MIRVSLLFGVAALSACATPPLCALGPETVPRGASMDSLEVQVFQALLLARGGDDPERECTGGSTRLVDVPETCAEHESPGEELPAEPVGPEDLVLAQTDGDYYLAFLPIRRYATGVVEGPVAIVVRDEDDLEVRALGALRTSPTRVALSLERVGEDFVLLADGEVCTGEPASCVRTTRVLLLDGRRFVAVPVVSPRNECLAPAIVRRSETRVVEVGARTRRNVERTVGLDVVDGTLRIDEQIVVQEREGEDPTRPSRVVRRSDAITTWTIDRAHRRFVSDGTSRWASMLDDARRLGNEGR